MLRSETAWAAGASGPRGDLFLYLEGPRDRGILLAWCRRLLPSLAQPLARSTVILGGRQPARALEHLRRARGAGSAARGLCVLDRDDGRAPPPPQGDELGLSFYTWGRRHIESYLLVPGAISRALGLADEDERLSRLLRHHLPPADDEEAFRELDAKRVLAPEGPLARALGVPIPLARVARATRVGELHADVHAFFARLRQEAGLVEAEVVRSA
jgi:hypothetical protein